MTEPALFDVIELLTDVPEHNQLIGSQGTIIECYGDNDFEVEFSNEDGEATAQFALSRQQFIVVWQSSTKQWLPTAEEITGILGKLLLNYARSIYQQA